MPVNYSLLQSMPKSNIIAQLPTVGGGGGGEDDIFGGLLGLIGKPGGSSPSQPNMPSTPASYGSNAVQANFGTPKTINNAPPMLQQSTPQGSVGFNQVQQQQQSHGLSFDSVSKLMKANENDPMVKAFLQKANPNLDPKVTPWCAGFVGSVLNENGIKGTGSLSAKSYLNYGEAVKQPTMGDIAVFHRGNNPALGHVGFVQGIDYKTGMVSVLGGNQGNSISIKQYPLSQLAGFRRPPTGQQVAQFAQQNGINSPQQIASFPIQQRNQGNGGVSAQSNPLYGSPLNPQQQGNNMSKPNQHISGAIRGAMSTYTDNPVLAGIAASQAILESNLGNKPSGLAKQNNYFGIKGSGTAGSVNMPTTEYINGRKVKVNASFAKNNSPEESFQQHKNLMSKPRYKSVLEAKTIEEAANALVKSGYATDPAYAKKLINIYNTVVKPNMGNVPQGMTGMEHISDPTLPLQQRGQPVMGQSLLQTLSDNNKYAPPQQPTPQQSQTHEDRVRELDQGRDDYAVAGGGINWNLLNTINQRRQA